MVSTASIISICIVFALVTLGPIALYVGYGLFNKGKGTWAAGALGAAGFFVMQVLIRLPILSVVALIPGFTTWATENMVVYALALAFTAGLFELVGRYAVAKILAKKMNPQKGIAAGIGHGGIEAMVIVGMTYVSNLIYVFMINTGSFDLIVEQTQALGTDVAPLLAVKDALIATAPGVYWLAALERVLTVIAHIAMSMLVCYFVWKKKDAIGIAICLVAHTALDFGTVMLSTIPFESEVLKYVVIYGFLSVVAAISLAVIIILKKKWEMIINS